MSQRIAGHDFEYLPSGRRVCIAYSGFHGATCGADWLHVRTCTAADVGITPGFSHVGTTNIGEYHEIRKEVEREETILWNAVVSVSSGR